MAQGETSVHSAEFYRAVKATKETGRKYTKKRERERTGERQGQNARTGYRA